MPVVDACRRKVPSPRSIILDESLDPPVPSRGSTKQPPLSTTTTTRDSSVQVTLNMALSSSSCPPGSDHFKVAIRLRPLPNKPSTETNHTPRKRLLRRRRQQQLDDPQDFAKPAWTVSTGAEESSPVLSQVDATPAVPGRHLFSFDCIFSDQVTTQGVYQTVAQPIVQAFVRGNHGTVFAYGQTGSGKTFTMQGSASQPGIVPLSAIQVLEQMKDDSTREYVLKAQFFEIYNEQVRDLLKSDKKKLLQRSQSTDSLRSGTSSRDGRELLEVLAVREVLDASGKSSVVVNAAQRQIQSIQDVAAVLREGNRNRSSSATLMNEQSSRSHAIFRLTLESCHAGVRRCSVLNLVDLAGSENSTLSGVTGQRKKEAGKINQSLLSLSRVIHALSLPPNKRPKHIGYRDSKLTRILQPHLSGNACMAVLCCVSPSMAHLEETRSTLKFAASAKRITVQPQVNEEIVGDPRITALEKELEQTKRALQQLRKDMLESAAKSKAGKPVLDESTIGECSDTENCSTASFHVDVVPTRGLPQRDGMIRTSCRLLASGKIEQSLESTSHMETSASEESLGDDLAVEDQRSETSWNPPLGEVVVLSDSSRQCNDLQSRLAGSQEKSAFLSIQLDATHDLVETTRHDLQNLQDRHLELKTRNEQSEETIASLRKNEDSQVEENESLLQQCNSLNAVQNGNLSL